MPDDRPAAFFGYGSLVNRATHDHAPARPATLAGWRRVWRQTRLRPFAFLSAEPAPGRIDGLVAAVPGDDWAALDRREAAYLRRPLATGDFAAQPDWAEPLGWAARVEIYTIDPAHQTADRYPILLSYLDVVVQGFLREFGADGVTRFFATTAGWTALYDDRTAPLYPRHQPLAAAERALTDAHVAALGLPVSRA
jgi:hypothetical protein